MVSVAWWLSPYLGGLEKGLFKAGGHIPGLLALSQYVRDAPVCSEGQACTCPI